MDNVPANVTPIESEPASTPPSLFRRLGAFTLAELKGLFLAFWRPFWKVSLAATILLCGFLGYIVFSGGVREPANGQSPSLVVQIGCILFLSVSYAIPVGIGAGLLGAVWRLCGWGILVPIITIPLAVVLSVWLCSGWLASEGQEAIDALKQSAVNNGLPETEKALEGVGKAAHGGIEVLALLSILLVPFLVVDAFWIVMDGEFLWQFVQFLLALVLAICLGLVPSTLLSLLVLSIMVVKRMKERYRSFIESLAPATPGPRIGE